MVLIHCSDCGIEVEAQRATRKYCSGCSKQRDDAARRRWAASDEGKASSRAATARWLASDRGREYQLEWDPDGSKGLERTKRFFKTGAGRAVVTKNNCLRFGVPYEKAMVIAKAVGDGEARCYWCGCIATDVDHVLPIAMAKALGMEAIVDDYVAAMCGPCHRAKSGKDRADIQRLKRTMPKV